MACVTLGARREQVNMGFTQGCHHRHYLVQEAALPLSQSQAGLMPRTKHSPSNSEHLRSSQSITLGHMRLGRETRRKPEAGVAELTAGTDD
jgi:hypothetical protein